MTIKFMHVHEFEHIALENYLNEMREKGYLLKRIGNFYIQFVKGESQNPYHVVVSGKRDEDGYQYVCGFGHLQVYQSNHKNQVKHELNEELELIKGIINKRISIAFLLLILAIVILLFMLLSSKVDYFAVLNLFANRSAQLTLLYEVLLILTIYRSEGPVRAFKKDPTLIIESAKLKGRGLSIFIGFLAIIMMFYYSPALGIAIFGYILSLKLLRKYQRGYYVAIIIFSLLFNAMDNILVAYQPANASPQEVYQVVFEDVKEYESLWLKTIFYENDDTRMLHVEIKESKLEGVICWMIENYYDVNEANVTYHKGIYIRKIDDDTYDLVQSEATKEWEARLSS